MLPHPPEGLRHWRPGDAAALRRAWSDPDIVAWSPPPPGLDPERWIEGIHERWERGLALDLVIIGTGAEVAGEVGLANLSTAPAPEPARAELGVWVAGSHRRRGAGARAVASVTTWALSADGLGLDQLWARTDPANDAAEALFASLGWRRRGIAAGKTIWTVERLVLR